MVCASSRRKAKNPEVASFTSQRGRASQPPGATATGGAAATLGAAARYIAAADSDVMAPLQYRRHQGGQLFRRMAQVRIHYDDDIALAPVLRLPESSPSGPAFPGVQPAAPSRVSPRRAPCRGSIVRTVVNDNDFKTPFGRSSANRRVNNGSILSASLSVGTTTENCVKATSKNLAMVRVQGAIGIIDMDQAAMLMIDRSISIIMPDWMKFIVKFVYQWPPIGY